jgi:hypothetical protein
VKNIAKIHNPGSCITLITDRSVNTPPNPTGRSITLFCKKMTIEMRHRYELIAYTAVATFGSYWCYNQHCWYGHVVHNLIPTDKIMPWIGDAIWLFALCAAMVIGLKGRFNGARPMGIALLFLVACMFVFRSPLGLLSALFLTILTVVQLFELIRAQNKREAEQAAP